MARGEGGNGLLHKAQVAGFWGLFHMPRIGYQDPNVKISLPSL